MVEVSRDFLILAAGGYLLGVVFSWQKRATSTKELVRTGLATGGVSGLVFLVLVSTLALVEQAGFLLQLNLTAVLALPSVTAFSWVLSWLSGSYFSNLLHTGRLPSRQLEQLALTSLMVVTLVLAAILCTIFLTLAKDAVSFFNYVSPLDFFFGLTWNMQGVAVSTPAELGQHFGVIPLLVGTLVISFLAVATALPLSIPAATYLSEYAGSKTKRSVELIVRILAGIPTIVYGFFALAFFGPAFLQLAQSLGFSVAAESALIAGFVTGLMIVPITTSVIYETMTAVPNNLREGSSSLGATKAETILRVVLPASRSGILVGLLLALSRAIGETMIVVMAAGVQADLTANPLRAMTTVTVQIVRALSGDAQFDSPKTLAAFALGAMLLVITVGLNSIAMAVSRRKAKGNNDD